MDLIFADNKTEIMTFSDYGYEGHRVRAVFGYKLKFDDDFDCWSYSTVIGSHRFIDKKGTKYIVTYTNRAHMLVDVEEYSDSD